MCDIFIAILGVIFFPLILLFALVDSEYRDNVKANGYPGDSEVDDLSDIRKWNKERKRKIKEDKKAEKERMKKMKGIAFRDFCEWKNKD